MYNFILYSYGRRREKREMKTLGYIYGVILGVMDGSLTAEEALELIRAALSA